MRPRKHLARALAAALTLAAAAAAGAQPLGLGGRAEDLVKVRLTADATQVAPGQTFHLALVFDVEPKWHIYWKNPGEGAMAPQIDVQAPPGFEVGDIRWPRPVAVDTPIGVEFRYLDQAVLFVPVTAAETLSPGPARFRARLTWAVCREVCKIGTADLAATVEITEAPAPGATGAPGATAAGSAGSIDPVLARHFKRLPRPLAEQPDATIAFDGSVLTLEGPAAEHRQVGFFPGSSPGVTYGAAETAVADGRFRITVAVKIEPANSLGEPMVLGGLVVIGRRANDPCYDFERAVNPQPAR